jgi:hypothetical protein
VFVFFDNDQKSAAPIDALKLKTSSSTRRGPFHVRNWLTKAALDRGFHTGISDDF